MRKTSLFFFILLIAALILTNCTATENAVIEFVGYLCSGDFRNASYYVSCSDGYISDEAILTREDIIQDSLKQMWADNMATLKNQGIYVEKMTLLDFGKVAGEKYCGKAAVTVIDGRKKMCSQVYIDVELLPPNQWSITSFVFDQAKNDKSIRIMEETLNTFLKPPPPGKEW